MNLLERSDAITAKFAATLPGTISAPNRAKLAELIRRMIRVEIQIAMGVPDEAGDIGGVEDN